MWPISNTQTFVNYFQNNGLTQSQCESLSADFEANEVEVCEGSSVNFTDMTAGVPITWDWTFEGGTPATSTAENPTVTYDIPGTYDVQLTVHDGVFTTDLFIEDYMTVIAYPNITLEQLPDACVQWEELELTGGSPAGGVYSGDFVENGVFHPSAAGIGLNEYWYRVWETGSSIQCADSASQTITVDGCVSINENFADGIEIYPNPATALVNITSESQIISIQVFNYTGQIILEKKVNGNSSQLDTSEFKSGIYSIKLETEGGTVVKNLIIK